MTKKFALKGINQDHTTCEICGRENLQKVMWLVELDPDGNKLGEAFSTGTTCGAKALGYTQANFKKSIKEASLKLEQKKSWAITNHPLTKQADKEKRAMRESGIGLREMRKSPEFAQWQKMYIQAQKEISSQSFTAKL